MTSSGKIRIYELSKDLNLDNKDVLDAARKLAIAAKSHSSSISSLEANQIKDLLKKSNSSKTSINPSKKSDKEILSVKKAPIKTQKNQKALLKQNSPHQAELSQPKLNVPLQPRQTLVNSQVSSKANNQKTLKNKLREQKQIIAPSKPNKPLPPKPREEANKTINKPEKQTIKKVPLTEIKTDKKLVNQPNNSQSTKNAINQPQKIYSQQPQRPIAPTSRPTINIQEKKQLQTNNQKTKGRINQVVNSAQKSNTENSQRIKSQNIQNGGLKTPQPPKKGTNLELVGAPIRRDKPMPVRPGGPKSPGSANRQGLSNRSGPNYRAGGPMRPGSPNRQGPNKGAIANRPVQNQNRPGANNRSGGPIRPGSPDRGSGQNRPGVPSRVGSGPNRSNNRAGVPSGMRKPVAPSELMQLQKPQARPSAPQRKTDSPTSPRPKRDNST